jgi:hypothetical protein
MTAAEEHRYVRDPSVVARRVGGETLLVPTTAPSVNPGTRAAQLYVLNETGERMWEWLSAPNTAADLARNLMGEFDVTPEAALDDAQAFVRSLEEAGLVVRTRTES